MLKKTDRERSNFLTRQHSFTVILFSALAFLFYLSTLAPTLLWGDDAYFQRVAYEGTLQADGGGHWLWFRVARIFVHLPLGDVAYRINLLSAVAAALTLFALYHAARALELSHSAALVTMASIMVSHTFWTHAVRAEVYTIFTLWLAVEIWLLAKWSTARSWPIEIAALLFGVGLLSHQMAILTLPAFALALWLGRRLLPHKLLLRVFTLFAAGLLLFLVLIQNQVNAANPLQSLILYFTHSGRDFSSSFFDFSVATLPRDGMLWLAFLGLQFAGLAGILGVWAIVYAIRQPARLSKKWYIIAALYLTTVCFALSYRVNDQFVFYLPSYIAFALFIGLGRDFAAESYLWLRRPVFRIMTLLLLICIPPLLYFTTASAFTTLGVNPLGIRSLPGREPNFYFLWPGKANYTGAAEYGRQALVEIPTGGALIADHTPYETILYLQRVEKTRPDLHLIKIEAGDDLAPVINAILDKSHIYLADSNPEYYNLHNVPQATLNQQGVIFQLVLSD